MRPNRMLVIAAVAAACVLISVPAASQKVQTQPVLVVNGSGQPVPTAAQGTTNVAGIVGLASGSTVNVGNTPTVNVSNTPNVNVTNTPTVSLAGGSSVNVSNPHDAANNPIPLATLEATQPYEDACSFAYNGAASGICDFQTIPAGKRLILQEFDAAGQLETGLKPTTIGMDAGGTEHYFTATFMGNAQGFDFFATHQETRSYGSSPSHVPRCRVSLSGSSSDGSYFCRFAGYLVDVP